MGKHEMTDMQIVKNETSESGNVGNSSGKRKTTERKPFGGFGKSL